MHANVDKAYEQENTDMSMLKKPFRIELRKTAVLASHRTKLIGVSGNFQSIAFVEVEFKCTLFLKNRQQMHFQKKQQSTKRIVKMVFSPIIRGCHVACNLIRKVVQYGIAR